MQGEKSRLKVEPLNQSKEQSVKELQKSNIIHAKFDDITANYIFETKPIGKGGFGEVYKCRHIETQEMRAIKHIKLKSNLKTIDSRGTLSFLFLSL